MEALKNKLNEEETIMVSIQCVTYNHEPYIRQCLEGFVMQKTNFKFEAIVHDDASTDKTADIIREYAEKYPDIIKPLYETENQFSKHNTFVKIIKAHTRGKYIAMCEGDDYWTDPYKLQKQVDFMEANPDFSLCCHRYSILDTKTGKISEDYCANLFKDNPNENIVFDRFFNLDNWLSKTLTVLFRTKNFDFTVFSKFPFLYDTILFSIILMSGKGCCLPFNGGIYRINNGGVCSSLDSYNRTLFSRKIKKELCKNNVFPNNIMNHVYVILLYHFFIHRKKIPLDDFWDLKIYLRVLPRFIYFCIVKLTHHLFRSTCTSSIKTY